MHSGHACHGTWPSNETIAIVVQMARMYDYVTLYAVIVCYSRSGIFIAEPINSIGQDATGHILGSYFEIIR